MKFLGKFRVLLVLGIIIIIFSSFSAVTEARKSKGNFVSFAVLNDGTVVVGTTYAISGYKENEEIFSFPVFFKQRYAINTNIDDNIIVYTKNGKFRFATDGTPLSAQKASSENYDNYKNRNLIYIDNNTAFCLTENAGRLEILKITENGKTSEYLAPEKNNKLNSALIIGLILIFVSVIYSILEHNKKKARLEYLENLDFVEDTLEEATQHSNNIKTHYVTYERKSENVQKARSPVFLPDFKKAFSKPEKPIKSFKKSNKDKDN